MAMILEAAPLTVRAGQGQAFEAAFAEALPIISGMSGFLGLELHKDVEHENRYLLLVRWRALEDHTVGFRGSPGYGRWKELLHHFYDPSPNVDHFKLIASR